jgi:hypothetical protein
VISARRRPHAAACALALFALNAFMIWPLFGVEYLRHLFSIEGTFIAIARAILEHRAWGTWWPWWGAGMPFEYTYLPGLPAATALVSRITGWSAAGSYHWVTALAYCLGPVMVFLLVWRMSSRWVPAAIAGLAFSLVSPATLLVPIVRQDAGGIASPQRLRALVYYGGGPEVATLALVSLAILLFHAALGKRRAWLYALAGASAAAVALTNAFGAAFLVLALACLAVAYRARLGPLCAVGVLAYLCVCRWLPPSLVRVAARGSQTAGGDYRWSPGSLLAIGIVAALFAAAVYLSRNWREPHLRFFLLLGVLLTSIVLGSVFSLNALPQPLRYHLEMEIPLCALAAFAAERLWRMSPRAGKVAIAGAAALVAVSQTVNYRQFAYDLILPPANLSEAVERRIPQRMQQLFGDERVMVSGSPALWANVFADLHQLAGAHDQFNPNASLLAAGIPQYGGLDAARLDGARYALWLKAFGVHGINVPGPASREPYKPFRHNPDLFEGVLPVAARDGDDTIYRVPQRHPGLARVVPADALVRRPPVSPEDTVEVERYVAALEDPSLAAARWVGNGVHARLQTGQVVSVAITYHPGWRATLRGVPQRTYSDGLGLLVVAPDCRGECDVQLEYDGGSEAVWTKWLSLAGWLAAGAWLIGAAARRAA